MFSVLFVNIKRSILVIENLAWKLGYDLNFNPSSRRSSAANLACDRRAWQGGDEGEARGNLVGREVEAAKLVRRWVRTTPDQNYPETGIRSFGKGTFHKPALTGRQIGNKRICHIREGDLVFMNVFAWEGAIAVAQPEDDGRVASHRFMMHEVLPEQATAEFLCCYFLTERGLEQIRGASPGSAGRNRTLGITKLEKIPVPVPAIENQRRFTKLRRLHYQLQRLHQEVEAELASFTPALLAKAFPGRVVSHG